MPHDEDDNDGPTGFIPVVNQPGTDLGPVAADQPADVEEVVIVPKPGMTVAETVADLAPGEKVPHGFGGAYIHIGDGIKVRA